MSKHTLKERVAQFNTMSLPGQPLGMHMGTSYLVNDLWGAHQELVAVLRKIRAEESVSPVIAYICDSALAAEPQEK